MVPSRWTAIAAGSVDLPSQDLHRGTILQDNHKRTLAIFAMVFFMLTLFSGAGFLGSILSTIVATVAVHFGLRYFESKKGTRPPE